MTLPSNVYRDPAEVWEQHDDRTRGCGACSHQGRDKATGERYCKLDQVAHPYGSAEACGFFWRGRR